jgi:hypothetical protein
MHSINNEGCLIVESGTRVQLKANIYVCDNAVHKQLKQLIRGEQNVPSYTIREQTAHDI